MTVPVCHTSPERLLLLPLESTMQRWRSSEVTCADDGWAAALPVFIFLVSSAHSGFIFAGLVLCWIISEGNWTFVSIKSNSKDSSTSLCFVFIPFFLSKWKRFHQTEAGCCVSNLAGEEKGILGLFLLMLALVAGVRFDLSPGPLAGSQTPVFGINSSSSSSRGVLHTDRNCLSSAGLFGFNRMKRDRYTQTSGHSAKPG